MAGEPHELPPALRAVAEAPDTVGVFLDYDGTLSPIVRDPDAAWPAPGAPEMLARLGRVVGRVAVISGRPASFLAQRLGRHEGVELLGLYGLQTVTSDGVVELAEIARPWLPVVSRVRQRAEDEAPPGLRVEAKDVSVTLHWREHPETQGWARDFVAQVSGQTGLAVQAGRMALELRPPVDLDKGTVVERLGAGLAAACYFGDDLGDLPAFAALDHLAAAGSAVARVAVRDAESPMEVLAAADLVLDGPEAAVALLTGLAAGSLP